MEDIGYQLSMPVFISQTERSLIEHIPPFNPHPPMTNAVVFNFKIISEFYFTCNDGIIGGCRK